MSRRKMLLLLLLCAVMVVLCAIFQQDCRAQTIDALDEVDKEYMMLNTDMTSYRIINEEHPEEYMSYYRQIREKILKKLKRNYTRHFRDGDVHLYFVLDKTGALARIDVSLSRSVKDEKLIDIALTSLQQAAPFGKFPDELSVPQMPFSLVITFKKDK